MPRTTADTPTPAPVANAAAPGAVPAWHEDALCAQTGPDFFFPEPGSSVSDAKRICFSCAGRAACLDYALTHDERFGVWGGLSEKERLALRRTRR